jgi:hypothetical protein
LIIMLHDEAPPKPHRPDVRSLSTVATRKTVESSSHLGAV